MEFFTIGVYGSDEKEFFDKLAKNKIDSFCDIRQRRGVRGSKYSFVNSNYLQIELKNMNINYAHILSLAPTTEIREHQRKEDLNKNELKKDRQELGVIFKFEYEKNILNNFDFEYFIETLENIGAKRVVLFCVEQTAEACHRSLVANKLQNDFNYKITHL